MGILAGAYGFIYPQLDGRSQIDAMAKQLSTCPADFIALDLEARIPSGMSHQQAADFYLETAEYCESTIGLDLIYTYPFYLECWRPEMAKWDLWISHVTLSMHPIVPPPWKTWTIWQWTGDAIVLGGVPGYPGHALRDRFNGDETALLGWAEK